VRKPALVASLLLCAGLGACTASPSPAPAATNPAEHAVPLPSKNSDLDAGIYIFNGFPIAFEVTVPDGWRYVFDRLLRKDVGATDGVFVWFGQVTSLPSDACQWPGTIAEVTPFSADSPSCTRWCNSSVAERQTYRVLDLKGERAIFTYGEFDEETDAALIQEAEAVFDSIRVSKRG
jgi:hypothetical protein